MMSVPNNDNVFEKHAINLLIPIFILNFRILYAFFFFVETISLILVHLKQVLLEFISQFLMYYTKSYTQMLVSFESS